MLNQLNQLNRLNGLGAHRKVGGEPYVTPVLPEADSIIRAWSTRRLIPAYKNNTAIKADRTDPLGGTPDDGFLVPFRNDGTILIPDGDDAYAYELHEQHGASDAKLINPVFANCPKVLDSNSMKKGLLFDGSGDTLLGTSVDTEIDAAFNKVTFLEPHSNDGVSLAFWYYPVSLLNNTRPIFYGSAGYIMLNQSATILHTLRFGSSASYASINIQPGEWSMISVELKNGTQKTYVNGELKDTDVVASLSPGSDPMSIGSYKGISGFAATEINDIVFWKEGLSGPQMLDLYNQTRGYYEV